MLAEFLQFSSRVKPGGSVAISKARPGFAEIDGMKIRPIDHWRDVATKLDEMLAPVQLFGFILRPERNMMHRTRRDSPHPVSGKQAGQRFCPVQCRRAK
jgi:hypothetical protein